jgi:hypothetical protein
MSRRALLLLPALMTTPGCIVVGGYSSTDGWFLWPGGILITFLFAMLLVFLARRRRF